MAQPTSYTIGSSTCWTGRKTDASLGIQYWYQAVEPIDLFSADISNYKNSVGLLGYACDEGVRRNQGRIGAAKGPDAIRSRLARVAWHHHHKIFDAGTISCIDRNLELSQQDLSTCVRTLLEADIFPILLGGGHDIAWGHFMGIRKFCSKEERIGIVNFDAHFDLRNPLGHANSGTPFFQILTDPLSHAGYLPIGIQYGSNTPELFDTADKFGVSFISLEDCQLDNNRYLSLLEEFINTHDKLYITVDLDGFSSAYAPGVSAPNPLGLKPSFVTRSIKRLVASGKVVSIDLAEMNPNFDIDNSTARLASELVDIVIRAVHSWDPSICSS